MKSSISFGLCLSLALSSIQARSETNQWAFVQTQEGKAYAFTECVDPLEHFVSMLEESGCGVEAPDANCADCEIVAHCLRRGAAVITTNVFSVQNTPFEFVATATAVEDDAFAANIVGSNEGKCTPQPDELQLPPPSSRLSSGLLPVDPCVQTESMDCSTPIPLPYFNDKFAKACVFHDYCYRHGKFTYGFTRKFCDDQFRARMRRACNGTIAKPLCTGGAYLYYEVVRNKAAGAFDSLQRCCIFTHKYEPCERCEGQKDCSPPARPVLHRPDRPLDGEYTPPGHLPR